MKRGVPLVELVITGLMFRSIMGGPVWVDHIVKFDLDIRYLSLELQGVHGKSIHILHELIFSITYNS